MKKIHALLIATTLSLCAASPAMAQFGGFGGLMGGSKRASSGDIDTNVKSFTEKSADINRLTAISLIAISAAYDKDVDAASVKARIEKLNSVTDTNEQKALYAGVYKTEGAKVSQLAQSDDLAKQTEGLAKDKQELVSNAVGNFLIAGFRALEVSRSGQSLLQNAASNPMDALKLAPVADALPLLGNAISTSTKIMPKFVDVLRGAKIEVKKVSAESKEVPITSI